MENTDQDLKAGSVDNRRDFLKRFGKYAAVTPVALTTLMSTESKAAASSNGVFHSGGRANGNSGH